MTTRRPLAASSALVTARARQPRWRAKATARIAWISSAAASPGMSLSGRLAVTSASGHTSVSTTAPTTTVASSQISCASGTSDTARIAPAIIARSASAAVSTGIEVQVTGTAHDRPPSACAAPATILPAAISTG